MNLWICAFLGPAFLFTFLAVSGRTGGAAGAHAGAGVTGEAEKRERMKVPAASGVPWDGRQYWIKSGRRRKPAWHTLICQPGSESKGARVGLPSAEVLGKRENLAETGT